MIGCGELLQRASLGLGNEAGCEYTTEHEEGEDFHDVVKPCIRTTCVRQGANQSLSDDGANFSRGGGDSMSRSSETSWKDLSGYCRRVSQLMLSAWECRIYLPINVVELAPKLEKNWHNT